MNYENKIGKSCQKSYINKNLSNHKLNQKPLLYFFLFYQVPWIRLLSSTGRTFPIMEMAKIAIPIHPH